ncbi:MAG: phosphatidate cytidylyltransferase [Phycisphaerales bacterium]|nr:phosphatidate cytidylyltransferase [Phycisphaerae bacterium]NNF41464.1 phosphatidate cytidylyltransferase [Phycisphaerales bacterium]NNM25016.1 phosphatidate cytidylyltransferase [Phycisphaerales bacterium]
MAGIFVALVVGTIARLTHLHRLSAEAGRALVRRLRTWWVIAFVVGLVVLLGRPATVGLVCLLSLLSLREYLAMVPERRRYQGLLRWVYAAAVLQYVWVYFELFELCIIFIPVLMFLLLTLRIVLMRQPEGFVHMVGTLQWGMMMLVFCLSHVALLLTLPPGTNPVGGGIGWFLYLVVLTEFNDIAQALWGRPLGRHKIIPEVSPAKSWEGLIGALVCTTLLAVLLAPLLTPLGERPPRFEGGPAGPWYGSAWAIAAGLMIGVGGFCGDVVISAVKRDAHVKDSGTLLPGQGGILDRVDSLTFTAPLFFHYVAFLYVP